jgi:hypothetical protein
MGVSIIPGHTALILMLRGAHSKAADLVRPITPAFELAYALKFEIVAFPPCQDATLTIEPPAEASRYCIACLIQKKVPSKFTLITLC